ncbi:threonine/serine exporter family protein [Mariniblastus fucicola]|uniref:Threonine/serine exporter family protein n=1 Tax=Mariniblastus fucicola TaxID=980251 RepID=A0A5B9P796_9BACT|nr:threonine/serine exporter family protein [Mariniblastus fucicola]QEG21065.1 hypothetical protein MFFC18_09170 [Mariniblastus fucicola]
MSENTLSKVDPKHAFLIRVGEVLHRHGTPSHRLERVWTKIANNLGVDGSCLYTPTSLLVSITDENGETTYLRRVDSGAVEVDKLIRFDQTLEKLDAKQISIAQASEELEAIADSGSPFPMWIYVIACAISCGAVAVFFKGTPSEVAAAAVLGLVVALLELLPVRLNWDQGLLEPIAGFVAAVSALAIANFVTPIDDRLVTLAALIVLVPGLKLTLALNELAVGHLSAGVARLAGACVNLLTLTVGVAVGWRVAAGWRNIPDPIDWSGNAVWSWVAIFIAPIMFAIIFRARWPQWPAILLVSIAGFTASLYGGSLWGIEVGAALGALAVGCGSNLYARLRDRPALVTLTPGILVLVPGSLGYRSLTAFLDNNTIAGIDFAFQMVIVAVSLVGGILTANVLVPPRRIL